jgi:hypothetical protein
MIGKKEQEMSTSVEMMAAAVRDKPHSFQFIRKVTGLTVTDEEFRAMAQSDPRRFKLVRFLARDDEGSQIRPGRPGVGLRRGRNV